MFSIPSFKVIIYLHSLARGLYIISLVALVPFICFNYFRYSSGQGLQFVLPEKPAYVWQDKYTPYEGQQLDTLNSKTYFNFTTVSGGILEISYKGVAGLFVPENLLFVLVGLLNNVLLIIIFYLITRILDPYREKLFFTRQNIWRIRWIGYLVVVSAFIRFLREELFTIIATHHLQLTGFHFVPSYASSPVQYLFFNLDLKYWIGFGLLILLIAEIFRYGMYLQEEKDLTI